MIIHLDYSLVESLRNKDGDASDVLDALGICAQHAREGSHIILGKRSTFDGLAEYFGEMNPRTAASLRRAAEKVTLRKQIRDFSIRSVRLVSNRVTTTPRRVVVSDCEELLLPSTLVANESGLLRVPLLMVENLNDGRMLVRLAESLVTKNGISDMGWLSSVPLRVEIAPGGGNTLADLYHYQAGLRSRLGISVVDSDIGAPGGSLGQTAGRLLSVAAATTWPMLEVLVLPAHTIENCIPRAEIKRVLTELDPTQAHRFDQIETLFSRSAFWRFVPLKGGIKCFELEQSSFESRFWTAVLGKRLCDAGKSCEKKGDCELYVIPSISNKLLAKCAEASGPAVIKPECHLGIAEFWQHLVRLFYSLFCGVERASLI